MKRILLLATTTGYQTRMFGEAAEKLGIRLLFATDRCDRLEDPWWDGAIAVRFHEEEAAADAIAAAVGPLGIEGLLAVGDRPTVTAACAARRLGLPGHPPEAARAARDKRLTRERLHQAGLPAPAFVCVPRLADPGNIALPFSWPVVVKPASLSGSRGVIRADTREAFIEAFTRVRRLLESPDIRVLRDPSADVILVEEFIPGLEYALEGLLHRGKLRTLAIFEKPDPLDGPFFEETIYVTPPRLDAATTQRIREAVAAAAQALGLRHGPVHAECRVNTRGVYVLEVGARPIGGLCARALRFVGPGGVEASLEELLLRHAAGEEVGDWTREPSASGVMMIPIPGAGVLRRVEGIEQALTVPYVRDVRITARPDQRLVPLPEGASYLGFIFAAGPSTAAAEQALRRAHAALRVVIDRAVPIAGQPFDCCGT
jgi:biotin carboxylase